ncbi:HD domain-containing protein [Thermodesulforhabdus norvegica]|uniref:5'-deoxynucleotidase n=1 Tax=Thermodesulforhabdus norvegica TaxID=39841 RepID=A0A1I4W7E2_9BACT|nr:HD domain-containing protein [Thermodesulforhabdus norvegica]SFN09322.1 metal dependent phosphohydrolase [Thermodesulforhabdus norvegica]
MDDLKRVARFLFETGMLKKIRRTGYPFLGSGGESVADHSFRTALIGHALALIQGYENPEKVVLMCLIHDLAEARTGDHNYVNKQYVSSDEAKAFSDAVKELPWEGLYRELWHEYQEEQTIASKLAHDADQLDLLVELKEQQDLGNRYASRWIKYVLKRLHTDEALKLAEAILQTDWTSWWFDNNDSWWVRNRKDSIAVE